MLKGPSKPRSHDFCLYPLIHNINDRNTVSRTKNNEHWLRLSFYPRAPIATTNRKRMKCGRTGETLSEFRLWHESALMANTTVLRKSFGDNNTVHPSVGWLAGTEHTQNILKRELLDTARRHARENRKDDTEVKGTRRVVRQWMNVSSTNCTLPHKQREREATTPPAWSQIAHQESEGPLIIVVQGRNSCRVSRHRLEWIVREEGAPYTHKIGRTADCDTHKS